MRILITNDDGINAKGIKALVKELEKEHEILVVAPREQKSATSHAITIHTPIKIKEETVEGSNCLAYSVVGTPADCTQIGISLLKGEIDLVISGINRGLNCGIDILYSGTVSAAAEAAIYNVPAIAISMDIKDEVNDEDYSVAAIYARKVLSVVKDKFIKPGIVVNLNVPYLNEKEIKGIKVCKAGRVTYKTDYILLEDNIDKVYKVAGVKNQINELDTDNKFIMDGYVTLTPLYFDFTNHQLLREAKDVFENIR